MSSGSSAAGNVICKCGKLAKLRTSSTRGNPGRKFHGCVDWKIGGCNFYYTVILGLHRSLIEREVEIKKLSEENLEFKALLADADMKLKKIEKEKQGLRRRMLISWVFFVVLWLMK
ncbi:hypothetical protein CASFOL_014287 [Castilleja foliolosa]|uniref:GRF-type domain-containing protein n=1 Tax=Castilleja foliolosa TaxID=1961234 RepID=A0ABD3DQ58_9LAMI